MKQNYFKTRKSFHQKNNVERNYSGTLEKKTALIFFEKKKQNMEPVHKGLRTGPKS